MNVLLDTPSPRTGKTCNSGINKLQAGFVSQAPMLAKSARTMHSVFRAGSPVSFMEASSSSTVTPCWSDNATCASSGAVRISQRQH